MQNSIKYRTDIDGLRAIAVISVIIFHLGYLPNGYLGVDVFFVISGFLITSIINKKVIDKKFSLLEFYKKRVRRIIPLLLFICFTTICLGLLLMLPKDIEDLAQSVVASILSFNNILLYITSTDYWGVKNEYNPLMHTWSLGVEEQFYVLYPLIFAFIKKHRHRLITILLLTVISSLIFILSDNHEMKFYFFHFRFFEIAIGGLCGVLFTTIKENNLSTKIYLYTSLVCLIILLISPIRNFEINVLFSVFLTASILTFGKAVTDTGSYYQKTLSNPLFSWIGKLSFSLYLWHQVVFAFSRYSFFETITIEIALFLSVIILLLSVFTYYLIEKPFRDLNFISFKKLVYTIFGFLILTFSISFYSLRKGGLFYDIKELSFYLKNMDSGEMFLNTENYTLKYNDRIFNHTSFDKHSNKFKILLIGDSFARDVGNILLESKYSKEVELSYVNSIFLNTSLSKNNYELSDAIIISQNDFISKEYLNEIKNILGVKNIDKKVWVFGIKGFGYNNGIPFFKLKRGIKHEEIFASPKKGLIETNLKGKLEWKENYIDMLSPLVSDNGKIKIFTKENKFISYDANHLIKAGAIYYSKVLDKEIKTIIDNSKL